MPSDSDVQRPDFMWLIPHTHWDREWYEPHDVFRARLVAMLDGLLATLESEPEYRFTLDGQSAAIEDYLEIRPEAEERVRAAVQRGQLALGPFQILLDEFCCDGETIVRNLEHGIRAARRFGPELRVGYLPDMFGHTAQMPQILRGFGIEDASLWRGAPGAVQVHGFVWEAPNGDGVRVEYQWDGYGSALKLFEPVADAPQLVADYTRENANWFRGEPIAGMYGTDHMAPRPDLAAIVRAYNASNPEVPLRIATIGEVVAARDHTEAGLAALPTVVGELRSHARGNLLPGVFSIRTGMKAAMADAERALTTAERLDAVLGLGSGAGLHGDGSECGNVRPELRAFFERGWGLTIESTAHDSVTGCGVDSTAVEVETRLRVAEQTAAGALDITLGSLAEHAPTGALAVFNQTGVARTVFAELTLEGALADLPDGCQPIDALPTVIGDEQILAADLQKIVRRIHGQEYFGKQLRGWTWDDSELVFDVADIADGDFELAEFVAVLRRKQEEAPEKVWRVRCVVPESHRVLVAGHAPPLGIAALEAATRHSARSPEGGVAESRRLPDGEISGLDPATGAQDDEGVTVSRGLSDLSESRLGEQVQLSNGLVHAVVRTDGLVDVEHLGTGARIEGALGLVDEGDCGDSYNFGPVEGGAVDRPAAVEIEALESGPLRSIVRIRRIYELPATLNSDDLVRQPIDTLVELRTGEDFLRVSVRLTNTIENHRLRVLLPAPESVCERSASAGQYGVAERGRTAEGGWGEYPLPTFPAYRWVHAGGVTAHLRQLTEYEIVPDAGRDTLALTVLRAVGMMSVNVHPLRDEPAGSQYPVPGAQYLGRDVQLDFAIDLSAPTWDAPGIAANSERFRFDPVVVPGSGGVRHSGRDSADSAPPIRHSAWSPEGGVAESRRLPDGEISGQDPATRAQDDEGLCSAQDDMGRADDDGALAETSVVLESLRRIDGTIEARFVNYSRSPQPLHFAAEGEWRLVDLTGSSPTEPAVEQGERPIDPWEYLAPAGQIVTLRRFYL